MEQIFGKNRRTGAWTLLCVLALVVLFSLLLWRVPFGYDWTDEAYYSTVAYRLLQGDRLLVDTWEVHQFSAMLSAPVLGAYLALNQGSTDGCILFMRYFYVSVQFLTSVYAFFVFRRRSGNLAALLVAAMLLGYITSRSTAIIMIRWRFCSACCPFCWPFRFLIVRAAAIGKRRSAAWHTRPPFWRFHM
jgi:hypothetical protein